ncbi:MAG TPA: cytochrome c3 family protein [Myxococcota bacterium]|nr:cytochrome c3 family protein [Myxococcota bacterium]
MRAIRLRRRWVEAACAGVVAAALVLGLPRPERAGAQAQSSDKARAAQAAAADDAAPGPKQPIPFNHALHAGEYKIDCQYCHSGTDRSRMAGMPSVEVCMGCHSQFGQDLEGVQTLKKYWDEKKPIYWEQVFRLPEHVKFRHNRHVAKGIPCQRCHGPIEKMDRVSMTSDTVWWPWLLPSQKLEMGWCIQCHRANQASQDCLTCHN